MPSPLEKLQAPHLIHAACIQTSETPRTYLFLIEEAEFHYRWYQEAQAGNFLQTDIEASTVEDALRFGRKTWKRDFFRTINCGFRYTLPERDEHGSNALYWQMAASYSSPNRIYFDKDAGNNCIVFFASNEAVELWRRLNSSP